MCYDNSNIGAAYRRAIPSQIRHDILAAIDHIENARMVMVPHRRHLQTIEDAITFLGMLNDKLTELRRSLPEWLPPENPL